MVSHRTVRASSLAGLSICALLASCDAERSMDETPTPEVAHREAQRWLDSTIHSLIPDIEAVRGRSFRGEVRGVSVPRDSYDSLMSALDGLVDIDPPPAEWEMGERTMVILGLADSIGQWGKAQVNFDKGSIQGFYAPENKTLYVFEDGSLTDRVYTVVHELIHVLQDERFGLESSGRLARDVDEDMAFTYAIEGEAEYVSIAVLSGDTSAKDMGARIDRFYFSFDQLAYGLQQYVESEGIPLTMALPVFAPYYMGTNLVSQRRLRSGWAGVDSFMTRPLRSTRAAIHPSVQDSFRDWNPGGSPDVSGMHRPLQTGRLGALYLGSLVWGSLDSRFDLDGLAASWNGDRFWTYGGDSGSALLWRLAWKDSLSARAFANTWWKKRASRRKAWGDTIVLSTHDTLKSATTPDRRRTVMVRVRGKDVVIVEGFLSTEVRDLESKLLALPDRTVFAARGASDPVFGEGTWTPPRPPVHAPPPRIPGLER